MELESKFNQEVTSSTKKTSKNSLMLGVLVVLNILCLAFIVAIVIYAQETSEVVKKAIASPVDHLAQEFVDSLPEALLPDSYAVPLSARNPATNQASRGTCWAWATLYNLETQYKQQGVAKGYLKENEYVKFSVQAFAAKLGNFCLAHPEEKVCQYGGYARPGEKVSTNDNQVEALPYFLKAIQDLNVSVVPDAVCPYIPTPSSVTDFQCPGFDEAVKKNPIRFNFKGMTTVYDTRSIKQLLYAKQHPLGIGTPLGTVNFEVRCDEEQYSNLTQCVEGSYICKGTVDDHCAVIQIQGRTKDGTFVSIDNAQRQTSYGGHAMNIVGYNDNWRYLNRIAGPKSVENAKGCLILHNSWMASGHSVEYLMGKRTLENEATSCPNHDSGENWIPATAECAIANYNDLTKCSQDIKRVRGHGLTNGADLLKCTSSDPFFCTKDNKYVLKRKSDNSEDLDVYELPNGLHSIGMITWSDEEQPKEVRIETLPFWALGKYFTPVNLVENNPEECGFYALPYQTIENMRRRNWDLFDNFKASDYEVEFEPSSYAAAPESKSYDTSYLLNSTYTASDAIFDGPIPFNLVY
jgi:hypothetical protein